MKYILISILFFHMGIQSRAQINVEEVNATMSQGVNRGFKVLIPETNAKNTQKAWEKYIKDQDGKLQKIRRSQDMVAKDITITAVNDMPMDVYSNIKESPEGVYLTVFYYNGSSYINSDMFKARAEAARASLESFASKLALEAINAQLAEEEKNLEKLEKEKAELVRSYNGFKEDIAEAEEDIRKANALIQERKKDIEKNVSEQKDKSDELDEQKSKLEAVKAKLKMY